MFGLKSDTFSHFLGSGGTPGGHLSKRCANHLQKHPNSSIFGLHFGAPGRPKIEKIRLSLCFSVRRALWIILGPLWAPFWSHFGVICNAFLVFFRSFSVIFPICVKGALMFAVSTGRLCFYKRKCGRERKRGTERNKRKR